MSRSKAYIQARDAASKRDRVLDPNYILDIYNQHHTNDKYRVKIRSTFPTRIPVSYPKKLNETGVNRIIKPTQLASSEELIDEEISVEYIADQNDTNSIPLLDESRDHQQDMKQTKYSKKEIFESQASRRLRTEIDSFLIGLENRYNDHTPFKVWNNMYTIGLNIAISEYSKKQIEKIIDRAIHESDKELGSDALDDVRNYHARKVIDYIKTGIQDGKSPEYYDTFNKVLNGKPLLDTEEKTKLTSHLGSMFSKYTDSAEPFDLEQFYNVGILIANRPFDRERMTQKLKRLIDERSLDEVEEIQHNKRKQLLLHMRKGFAASRDPDIRNAYDLNGKYNYGGNRRDRLKIRARIDGLMSRTTKSV